MHLIIINDAITLCHGKYSGFSGLFPFNFILRVIVKFNQKDTLYFIYYTNTTWIEENMAQHFPRDTGNVSIMIVMLSILRESSVLYFP